MPMPPMPQARQKEEPLLEVLEEIEGQTLVFVEKKARAGVYS